MSGVERSRASKWSRAEQVKQSRVEQVEQSRAEEAIGVEILDSARIFDLKLINGME